MSSQAVHAAPAAATAPADTPADTHDGNSPASPTPGRPVTTWRRHLPVILAGALGGVLLGIASPPFDLHLLAFIGLVPVIIVATDTRRGIIAGAVCGFVWFGFELSWVFSLAWFGWFIVAGWLAVVLVVWGAAAGFLRAINAPFLLRIAALPSVLVVAEWLQGRWPGGFASQLGVLQHNLPFTRAIAAAGGIAIVGWLTVAANTAIAEGIIRVRARKSPLSIVVPAATLCGVALAFGLGWLFRPSQAPVGTLAVGIVQANDMPGVRVPSGVMVQAHLDETANLDGSDYDVILWSESSLGQYELDDFLGEEIAAVSDGTPVLANSYVNHPSEPLFYNRNALFDESGEVIWTYDKRKLVPFGEYVPMRNWLRWITLIQEGVPRDGVRGDEVGIFDIDGHPIGSLICFEIAIGELTRETVREGAQAIVVSINNSTYGYSHESEQMLAVTRMRAVQSHRAIAVPAVSGASATIQPDGNLTQQTELFERATLDWDMPLQTDLTISMRVGDWVLWMSWLLVAAGAVFSVVRVRRRAGAEPA